MAATELLIEGALITRVDRPLPSLYALSLSSGDGNGCLLLAGGPARPRTMVALVGDRPRGEGADAEVRGLREKLESGHLLGLASGEQGSDRALWVKRGEHVYVLRLSARGLTVSPRPSADEARGDRPAKGSVLALEDGGAFVAAHAAALLELEKRGAVRAIQRAMDRLRRRVEAIADDARAMAEADAEAARARLFVGAARTASRHARELTATDWSTGEAVEIRFPLRGDRPAHEELSAVFHRAKRLRGGVARGEARVQEAELATALLTDAATRVEASPDQAGVERELARLARTLPGDIRLERPTPVAARATHGEVAPRRSYRTFTSTTGASLLVGKGGADNDDLTLHVARPYDHFFHAKDAKGAHVIAVAPKKGASLDPRILVEGALLAAHFSDRRGEAVVDVQHCARRHLRKRKGSPPGLVELTQEKVLAVRADETILARLLASEDRG